MQGATRQVRFQPRCGTLLAAASGNGINLFDVETNTLQYSLEVPPTTFYTFRPYLLLCRSAVRVLCVFFNFQGTRQRSKVSLLGYKWEVHGVSQ